MSYHASIHRIDANTIEVTTIQTQSRTFQTCEQCGITCRLSDEPTVNGTMRAGQTRCYGCQWANVGLSGRTHAGISFARENQ